MAAVDHPDRQSHELWDVLAPTWERNRAFIEEASRPVREWMIDRLAPRTGDTVLELAAGAGETGFRAASIVGGEGRLISSDLSAEMVAAARRRGAELGLDNVQYRVIDAERIELDTDSVDGVLCRFGYMLMPDPAAALAETRRVLRDGGRLVLAVIGPPERNPFFALTAMALVRRGHLPPPAPERPGPFSMASEERTMHLLRAAGFDDVRIEQVPGPRFVFADVDEYLGFVADTAGPIALALRSLPAPEREQIRAELERALAAFATGDRYDLPGATLAAAAS